MDDHTVLFLALLKEGCAMNIKFSAALVASLAAMAAPTAASAQNWTPGAEIVGQSVQVNTNGTINTVYFDQGGAARIMTPSGNTVPGRWTTANQQLCLDTGTGTSECWPYRAAFKAGEVMNMTSSCNSTSQWTATGVNMPEQQSMPERG
jgi:hypothetical protein